MNNFLPPDRSLKPRSTTYLASFADVGTGGLKSESFYRNRFGYRPFEIVELRQTALHSAEPYVLPYAAQMQIVKAGFGRTMARLPEVFGVSRQALYNWLNGDVPKPIHHGRLRELAEAARVFLETGFKPTPLSLDRAVSNGKSLLQLLCEGASGRDNAQKLIRIVQRGQMSRTQLTNLLQGRHADLKASDIAAPLLNEHAGL